MYLFDVSALHSLSGTNTPDLFLSPECIFCWILSHVFLLHYIFPILLFLSSWSLSWELSFLASHQTLLQFYNLPILFYSVIHHFILKSQNIFIFYFLLLPCVFSLLNSLNIAQQMLTSTVAHPSVTFNQSDTQLACRTWCWLVTAIMHYSNAILQDWLQETDLAFQKY